MSKQQCVLIPKNVKSKGDDQSSNKYWMEAKNKVIQDLFTDTFPLSTEFVKIGKNEWRFQFPKLYHELTEELWSLEESNVSTKEYLQTLNLLLKFMPDLFDAANDLAHFYIDNNDQKFAKRIYEKYIYLAKSYIPKEFVIGKHNIIWGHLDNRPFLRLLSGHAQFIKDTQNVKAAIPLYEEILQYNPNDNQGIRAILSTAYLKTNQSQKIIKLATHYPNEILPELVMGNILALIKLGEIDKARKSLERNKKYQRHVIKELLKNSHPKPKNLMEGRVTVGGEDEAYYYWQDQGMFWETTKGAKSLLESCI